MARNDWLFIFAMSDKARATHSLFSFQVICSPISAGNVTDNKNVKSYTVENGVNGVYILSLNVTNLLTATEYNCSVAARTDYGYGQSVSIRVWTTSDGEYPCFFRHIHIDFALNLIFLLPVFSGTSPSSAAFRCGPYTCTIVVQYKIDGFLYVDDCPQ